MIHKNMIGKLNFGRIQSSRDLDKPIRIEVIDRLSGSTFCEVRVGLAEMMEAITGRGYIEVEFDLRPDVVGMKHEHKTEIVPFDMYADRYNYAAKQRALSPFEGDGWKGRMSDLENIHNRREGGMAVIFDRYVPVEEIRKEAK